MLLPTRPKLYCDPASLVLCMSFLSSIPFYFSPLKSTLKSGHHQIRQDLRQDLEIKPPLSSIEPTKGSVSDSWNSYSYLSRFTLIFFSFKTKKRSNFSPFSIRDKQTKDRQKKKSLIPCETESKVGDLWFYSTWDPSFLYFVEITFFIELERLEFIFGLTYVNLSRSLTALYLSK